MAATQMSKSFLGASLKPAVPVQGKARSVCINHHCLLPVQRFVYRACVRCKSDGLGPGCREPSRSPAQLLSFTAQTVLRFWVSLPLGREAVLRVVFGTINPETHSCYRSLH